MVYKITWFIRRLIYFIINPNMHFYGYLGKPICIRGFHSIKLKRKTRIFPGVRLECHGKGSSITIEDNTSIGQNFHCTSGGSLLIGRDTVISGNVCITNIDHDYSKIGTPVLNQSHIINDTEIGSNCFIGFGAVIQAGTVLGDQCIVGANSVVRGVFPPFSVIVGSPAKIVKKYNLENNDWSRV